MTDNGATVFDRIANLLNSNQISFQHVTHPPTFTSEESAKARGVDLKIGGKAILMKIDQQFRIFIISAALKVDSNLIKEHFGVKKIRFASKEELFQLTGLQPGSLPPFGQPIFDLNLFADPSVLENDRIAFNAGALTDSIILNVSDWQKVANPEIFNFAAK